jgi:Zn-dependent peptidase ImmA (M78 family)/transcriptional regulator with XRE-family HTH domain
MTSNISSLPDRSAGFVPHRLVEARMSRRLSRSEVGRLVGVSGQAIAYYESGERRPDMSAVLKFSDALGRSPGFFLHPGPPFGGSCGTRFFRSTGHRSNRLNESLDVRLKWLWEISSFLADMVRFPEPNIAPPSLISGDGYLLTEIEHVAMQTRRHWGLGDGPIANVVALLETHGVILTRFSMGSERIDAFSSWLSGRPYIVLGSGKQSSVRSRFDAVHELAHLILHQDVSQEDMESPKVRERIEREANQFAGAFLLPRASLLGEFYSTRLNHLQGLKRRWRVSMQAIAHRAMQIGALDEEQYINFRKQMSAKKWITMEPLDDEISFEEPSFLRKSWELVSARTENICAAESGFWLGPDLIEEVAGFAPFSQPTDESVLRRISI